MAAGCVEEGQLLFCPDARWRPWRVTWLHSNCWEESKRFHSERRARAYLARKQGKQWKRVDV